MTRRGCARAALAAVAVAAAGVAAAQAAPFTEAQAAAGRASYLANCAGCHLADLRGANEARPLVGPDFMRTWSGRTAQELVAFLSVTMPPPPATPGSLGPQSYVNLAAFLLHANGATPGADALTSASTVSIGSVATGTMSDAFPRWRSRAPRRPARRAPRADGHQLRRRGSELQTRDRRNAAPAARRRLAHDPRQLSGVELQRACRDHARQRRASCASNGSGQ